MPQFDPQAIWKIANCKMGSRDLSISISRIHLPCHAIHTHIFRISLRYRM